MPQYINLSPRYLRASAFVFASAPRCLVGCSAAGGDSSEDEESERIKLRLGVGEGWALRGVFASCITNEWRQESDVIAGPVALNHGTKPPAPLQHIGAAASASDGQIGGSEVADRGNVGGAVLVEPKPSPSVSWASWLLSFLLNHPSLRRLAMRPALFRTLVAYLRSPRAPHRLRVVPLLTLLIRSHAEFKNGPPPFEELNGLMVAVLQECDRATCGRGPGSAAWRPSDCPGGMQLETKWANEGLLLLTDLVTATRRAQDSLRQQQRGQSSISLRTGEESTAGLMTGSMQKPKSATVDEEEPHVGVPKANSRDMGAVRVSLPPFGTRIDESPVEEGEEEEAEEVERSLADRLLFDGRSLCAEERSLLEVDLRNAVLPDATEFAPISGTVPALEHDDGGRQEAKAAAESPSRCLHHLIEIMDTLRALRTGWPSPLAMAAPGTPARSKEESSLANQPAQHLDSILCEAWMDAVGPAAVIESEHPFREGTKEETLCFPGAEEMVVLLDPRSSMQVVSLARDGKRHSTLRSEVESGWHRL